MMMATNDEAKISRALGFVFDSSSVLTVYFHTHSPLHSEKRLEERHPKMPLFQGKQDLLLGPGVLRGEAGPVSDGAAGLQQVSDDKQHSVPHLEPVQLFGPSADCGRILSSGTDREQDAPLRHIAPVSRGYRESAVLLWG